MSRFTEAFERLLDRQERATGQRYQATVDGITADAIVEELTFDEITAAGGTAERGGFRVTMRESDFTGKPGGLPTKFSAATARGKTEKVIAAVKNNGMLYITCADPAYDDTNS